VTGRTSSSRQVTKALERDLLKVFGPVVTGEELYRMLGLRSGSAFRQAKRRGRLPVPVFNIEGRKGTFAYTKAIAAWLVTQGSKPYVPNPSIGQGRAAPRRKARVRSRQERPKA
jgi:hypothetical protein